MMNYSIPTYETLLRYGEITADYRYKKFNMRVIIFNYNNGSYKVVVQNGKIIILKNMF